MEKKSILDIMVRARDAATECEQGIAAQKGAITALRASGHDTAEAERILSELDAKYEALMVEMEKLLDELDNGGAPAPESIDAKPAP